MSLDKFISGKPTKKKKKKAPSKSKKPGEPVTNESQLDSVSQEDKSPSNNLIEDAESDKNIQNSVVEQIPKQDSIVPPVSIDTSDDSITLEAFKNKTKFELFKIIEDLVHSSRTYSRNKNLLTQLFLEKPDELIPEVLSQQLEISYFEVLFILSEIKTQIS